MQILDRIRQISTPETAPAQRPGRHSTVGLVERLTRELAELRESRDKEVRGYIEALQQAGRDVQEARQRSDFHMRGWQAADREVKRLKELLKADAGVPVAAAPAPADVEGSCFTQPDPAPVTEGPRAVADTPVVAETYEVSDPNAETQAVAVLDADKTQPIDTHKVRELIGMGRTAVIPVVPVAPPTQIPAGPGSTDPTEISQATGKRAVINVAQHLDEAS